MQIADIRNSTWRVKLHRLHRLKPAQYYSDEDWTGCLFSSTIDVGTNESLRWLLLHLLAQHVTRVVRLDQQSSAIPCQGLVLGNQWRELENMKAQFVAVNGIRKVACVVS